MRLDLILLVIPAIYSLLIVLSWVNDLIDKRKSKKSKSNNRSFERNKNRMKTDLIIENKNDKKRKFETLDISSEPICVSDFKYYEGELDLISKFSNKIINSNKKQDIINHSLLLKQELKEDEQIMSYINSLRGSIKYLHNACINIDGTLLRYDYILITYNGITLLDTTSNPNKYNKKLKFSQFIHNNGFSVKNIDYHIISININDTNYYKNIINKIDYNKTIDFNLNRISFLLSEFVEKSNNDINYYLDLFEITSDDFSPIK